MLSIQVSSTPTFSYFALYLYSSHVAHYVQFICKYLLSIFGLDLSNSQPCQGLVPESLFSCITSLFGFIRRVLKQALENYFGGYIFIMISYIKKYAKVGVLPIQKAKFVNVNIDTQKRSLKCKVSLTFAFCIGSTPTFYISTCISTLPTKLTIHLFLYIIIFYVYLNNNFIQFDFFNSFPKKVQKIKTCSFEKDQAN